MDQYQRKRRWMDLLLLPLTSAKRIRNPRALQHLQEGFNRRVLMMDASLRQLDETAAKAGGKPISPYAATDLATHLNALYLNLCGALDNLAWALQHERSLLTGVTEEGRGRLRVGLFSESFLAALEAVAPNLEASLRHHATWHTELRSLRDPGAHRIPIYAVPGIMNEQQGAEAIRLSEESARRFLEGKHEEGMELMFLSTNLGTYQPLMALSHEGRFELRNMLPQVAHDEEHFIEVAESVLHCLFLGSDGAA
jgi:hypothetical protein